MTVYVGKTNWWWRDSPNAPSACQAKAAARLDGAAAAGKVLNDGSIIICVGGGAAWIVAPSCTQVAQTWNGTTSSQVGDKCCVCDWSTLNSRLISCGFNPCDWFVPCYQLLQNPGYVCRTNWDSFSAVGYWSSTEITATGAFGVNYTNGCATNCGKACSRCVRAFRCVTY